MQPRSIAIPKNWSTFDFSSLFSAFLYPALGLALLIVAITLGFIFAPDNMSWWQIPAALFAVGVSLFICNMGIGALHRVWQHKAGELSFAGHFVSMISTIFAMQGSIREWINYHSQHHRFADKAGDPHNPFESKSWAWVGWILWRDAKDMNRPMPNWIAKNRFLSFMDKRYNAFAAVIHFGIPAIIYGIVWLAGGSLIWTALIHASVVIGRGIHFHATTLGINVCGHLKMPKWVTVILALLTGGEAYHDHHHDEPTSALHLPRKGLLNRLIDYNGTLLLIYEKLGLARGLVIAPQFR